MTFSPRRRRQVTRIRKEPVRAGTHKGHMTTVGIPGYLLSQTVPVTVRNSARPPASASAGRGLKNTLDHLTPQKSRVPSQ